MPENHKEIYQPTRVTGARADERLDDPPQRWIRSLQWVTELWAPCPVTRRGGPQTALCLWILWLPDHCIA